MGFEDVGGDSHSVLVEAKHVGFVRAIEHVFDGWSDEIGEFFEEGLHLLFSKRAHSRKIERSNCLRSDAHDKKLKSSEARRWGANT